MTGMQQLWITGPQQAQVRIVERPVPGDGEVLVSTAFAGICGSDLHTLQRGHPWLPYPLAPGHEGSGVVIDDLTPPAGARRWSAGDRVYLRPLVACGECFYCRRELPNLCANLIGVGSHTAGFFADVVSVPRAALAPVPAEVSLADAAMIEPLATAVHAVRLSRLTPGATVVVTGGGSIGLSVLLAAEAADAATVVICEPQVGKRELAVQLGAAAALDPADGDIADRIRDLLGGRPDVVFDCVAAPATIQHAVRLASRGGTVVVVGVGHGPVQIPIESVQDDEVAIIGSAMYHPADFDRAERLVVAGVPVGALITAVLPLERAVDGLTAAAGGLEVKVHLTGPAAGTDPPGKPPGLTTRLSSASFRPDLESS